MLKKKLVQSGKLVNKKPMLAKKHEEELEDDETSNVVETEDEEDVEEDEEEDSDDEKEETPPPKKKGLLAKKGSTSTSTSTNKASKKSPLERAFANVPSSNDAVIRPGKYEMIIKEIVLQPYQEGKGQKARAKFIVCDPDYVEMPVTIWYNLIGKDGEPSEFGISIFRQEMAKLGYEVGTQVTEEEIEEMFEEVTKDRPGIVASLSYREWQGRDLAVVNIAGTSTSDVIEEYKDQIPF
jgi:hypothetical protein